MNTLKKFPWALLCVFSGPSFGAERKATRVFRAACPRLLQYHFSYLSPPNSLENTDVERIRYSRKRREGNTLCGVVALSNGLSEFRRECDEGPSYRGTVDHFKKVLSLMMKRTRRDLYGAFQSENGYSVDQLKWACEESLKQRGIRARVTIRGPGYRERKSSNLMENDFLLANRHDTFVIALLRVSDSKGVMHGFGGDVQNQDEVEEFDEKIFRSRFSVGGKETMGHFVNVKGATQNEKGFLSLNIEDPDRPKPYSLMVKKSKTDRIPLPIFRVFDSKEHLEILQEGPRPPYLIHHNAKAISHLLIVRILDPM